ncbi:DUF4328 domain-containing protein [Nocardioides KLBMP 9356]|uniref:DUF4328 domain-containing protein n=1 Tax=Nocardioides potassii TaxID=2911371 RepID=A0ABS9HFA5_9ACTN|nr:DUF4328 domain-containing protein [Nocardioides potassii]MCF6378783.1 DUF4328 domain-containing protein [Nocardioides potassii]
MSLQGEGWYADPQDGRRLRWWDGERWTEHTHAREAAGSGRSHPRLGTGWRALAVVVQLALLGCVATSAFVLYTDLAILDFVEELALRPDGVDVEDGVRIDRLMALSLVDVGATLLTGVLFISWHYQLHNSSRMDRSAMRHGTGWTIGGWLVPVLSLWRPFQMVTDVRRGLTGDGAARPWRLQGWWWGCFATSLAIGQVASYFYNRTNAIPEDDFPGYVDLIGTAAAWERWSAGLSMVAAMLAIVLVRRMTRQAVAEPAAA